MVRSSAYRKKKYENKIGGTEVEARFTAQKDHMVEQENVKLTNMVSVETAVKAIVEAGGASVIDIPFYLDVGREMWKKYQKFTGTTLDNEFDAVRDKWVARGLTDAEIIKIADLFAVTLT